MTDETDEHSAIRFARASRAIRPLSLAECVELLQLVEGPIGGGWGKFEDLLSKHAIDHDKENDRQALRVSLIIRRMELEKAQIEEGKKRYPDTGRGRTPSDNAG